MKSNRGLIALIFTIVSIAPAKAQAPMAFGSDLTCGGKAARFGVVANVPTFEIDGRRYAMNRIARLEGVTTYRSSDRSIRFLARGKSGTLVYANGRRLRCAAVASQAILGRQTMQSPAGATDTIEGGWRVKRIAGELLPAGMTVTMEFGADGRIAGRSGCNRYFGSYSFDGTTLKLSQLGGTRMACPPPQMAVEERFLSAVTQVTGARLSDARELVLTGASGPLLFMDRIR